MLADRHAADAAPSASARRARYAAVLDSLRVPSNPRYQRGRQGRDETYCNIFVADATRALGAPVPEYIRTPGSPTRYLTANAMHDWLFGPGAALGWRLVSADEAQAAANAGQPAVAAWKNPDPARSGHIAMVRPGAWPVSAERGPRIAQAGRHNFASADAVEGFGGLERLAEVCYFAHGAQRSIE